MCILYFMCTQMPAKTMSQKCIHVICQPPPLRCVCYHYNLLHTNNSVSPGLGCLYAGQAWISFDWIPNTPGEVWVLHQIMNHSTLVFAQKKCFYMYTWTSLLRDHKGQWNRQHWVFSFNHHQERQDFVTLFIRDIIFATKSLLLGSTTKNPASFLDSFIT